MKTFLHYTKEKELDEGIGSLIARGANIAGKVVRGTAKALDTAQTIAGDFEKGGLLGAARGSAGRAIEKAEKETKEKGQLAGDKADCVRRLNYYQKLLNNARSSGSPDGKIVAAMDRVKSECAGVMKASTYDKLAKEREKEDRDIIADFDNPVAGKKGFDKYG